MTMKRKQDSQPVSTQDRRDDICTLNDAELELIAGGISEIVVTKDLDTASTNLFK